MKAVKALAYVVLIGPLYILLNTIFRYAFMGSAALVDGAVFNPQVYGFYCHLKKHAFDESIHPRFLEYAFTLAAVHLLCFLLLFWKRFDRFRSILIILFSLDIIALICYLLFEYMNAPFFRMFFTNSAMYLVSGYLTGLAVIIPLTLIILKAALLTYKHRHFMSKHSAYLFLLSLLSVLFWYMARIVYFRYS
ncbi:MAG: hypothetical protein V4580_16990 [Bacteroidota bacterium]